MKSHEVTCTSPLVCAIISLSGAGAGLASARIGALVGALICRSCARGALIGATARIASPSAAAIRSRTGTCSQCSIWAHGHTV